MKKTQAKITRRPYCKPQLERVKLTVEEAVLTVCKTHQGSGSGKSTLVVQSNAWSLVADRSASDSM